MSNAICSIEECERPRSARGWCGMHYQRWQRNGDPRVRVLAETPADAFRASTTLDGDCLVWTGELSEHGYGRISVGRKRVPAHRWAWEQENGPVPDGMVLDHVCSNRKCVKVPHLRLATQQQNTRYRNTGNVGASGYRNVYLDDKRYPRYVVSLKIDGKTRRFGTFATPEEATAVAAEKRAEFFGEFAGKG